ncbi:MAG TPA: sugar phosphate nucleotidyltransferase [Bacteroidota bacterium]|nr:sugar phosphate nucleotidyltransferase [Bacteroidota bacterium]
MKAGIISAGEGSRLRSEGLTTPKPLIEVGGVPLIGRLIQTFLRHGITEIACIVNEYSLQVKEYVESLHLEIPVRFVVKTTPSSMHSLFALAPYLQDGQFLLSTVDPIFDEKEFSDYLNYCRLHPASDGILAITRFIDDEHPLYVQLNEQHQIESFSKSGRTEWITGGMYVFSPVIFREMEGALQNRIERLRNFLNFLLSQGYCLEGFPFSKIVDVDHRHDIAVAEKLLNLH